MKGGSSLMTQGAPKGALEDGFDRSVVKGSLENPNIEIRNSKQTNPNPNFQMKGTQHLNLIISGFGHLKLFRISCFGFPPLRAI